MIDTKIYKFINEIIETAKEKGFSSKKVNEQFDIVIKTLKIEGDNTSAEKINLLKKYTSGILSGKVALSSVFEVISFELNESICLEKNKVDEEDMVMEPCHSPIRQYSIRCGLSSNDRCGSSSSNDRCGFSSSSSCGSSTRNSRC